MSRRSNNKTLSKIGISVIAGLIVSAFFYFTGESKDIIDGILAQINQKQQIQVMGKAVIAYNDQPLRGVPIGIVEITTTPKKTTTTGDFLFSNISSAQLGKMITLEIRYKGVTYTTIIRLPKIDTDGEVDLGNIIFEIASIGKNVEREPPIPVPKSKPIPPPTLLPKQPVSFEEVTIYYPQNIIAPLVHAPVDATKITEAPTYCVLKVPEGTYSLVIETTEAVLSVHFAHDVVKVDDSYSWTYKNKIQL